MGVQEKLIDLPVAMKAVSDGPGIHDQDFLASCIMFKQLSTCWPEAHCMVVLTYCIKIVMQGM